MADSGGPGGAIVSGSGGGGGMIGGMGSLGGTLMHQNAAAASDPVEMRRINFQTPAMMQHPPISINQLADHIDRLKTNDNQKFSQEYEVRKTICFVLDYKVFVFSRSNPDSNSHGRIAIWRRTSQRIGTQT